MRKPIWYLVAALAVLLLALTGALVSGIWRGTPLAVAAAPAPLSGTVYFLKWQPDQLLALMQQPADLSRPAEKLVHRSGCGESNCNVVGPLQMREGVVEYSAMYAGQWYRFRAGQRLGLAEPTFERPQLADAVAERGSLVVDGREVLHYPGSYDLYWAAGYEPLRWIGNDRYLAFWYNGYTSGGLSFLGNLLGPDRSSTYLWDRQTGQVTRFVADSAFLWTP